MNKSANFQQVAGEISIPKNTDSFGSRLKKSIQRNMYQYHRIIGLITVIPVIFWCVSGLMHPFMSHWFKPQIAHEFAKPEVLNKEQITLSVQDVLKQNNVSSLRNFRLITLNGSTYYQIKQADKSLAYFNASTGQALADGDKKYAESLGRYFLEDNKSKIRSITQVTAFDDNYRYVNRLLPVWKIAFDRSDNMDVYVETEQTRLANFNENRRKAFLWIFNNFHTWDFLEKITNNALRLSVMILLLSIIVISSISGLVIYGFMWKKFKKPKNSEDKVGILKKYHRQIGIAVAFVSFTFAFSGIYHATKKFTPDERINYYYQPLLKTAELAGVASTDLPIDWAKTTNLSLAKIDEKLYYQVFTKSNDKGGWKKEQQAKAEKMFGDKKTEEKPNIAYYDVAKASLLPDGITEHAKDLVARFWFQEQSGGAPACCENMAEKQSEKAEEPLPVLASTAYLSKFSSEYGFVNKRLPVVQIALKTADKATYYVEPATSRLGAKIVNSDRREGLSFAVLHKYFLMDWAGKDIRDITMMLAAAGVLTVSLFGLALYLKIK